MKLYAPAYYKDFYCIADKCKNSCCIGWEIDIDSETVEKYKTLSFGYGGEIIKTIDFEGAPHFKLCGERCPHLTENGLCRIITELSEDYLAEICREHPRFYNPVNDGYEVGLGLSCEEAARIVLSSDGYADILPLGESGDAVCTYAAELRGEIYGILSNRGVSYSERLSKIYNTLGISLDASKDGLWREVFSKLELLREENFEIFECYSSKIEESEPYPELLERFLAYLIYRHCHMLLDREELTCAYGFALLLERLFASAIRAKGLPREKAIDLARKISEEIEYSEDNTEELKLAFY